MSEINYQEAYEREHEKCADLADKIVVLESEKEDLQFKLDRIKKNKFWKATGPARSLIHFAQRQRDRLSHCGGPKDILCKIRNKSRQKSLMESYGTGSFPDAEQRKRKKRRYSLICRRSAFWFRCGTIKGNSRSRCWTAS